MSFKWFLFLDFCLFLKEVDEAEENPEHEAIKAMMDSLFSKLNALSNFTYTPKQVDNTYDLIYTPIFEFDLVEYLKSLIFISRW